MHSVCNTKWSDQWTPSVLSVSLTFQQHCQCLLLLNPSCGSLCLIAQAEKWNPNNQDHHNHRGHPHYDLQGLRLCGTSRLLPTDEGLTVGREQRTYLWRIKSINKFQKSYFLSSLWHTGKSFGSSIFASGVFCILYFCISSCCDTQHLVKMAKSFWSLWPRNLWNCLHLWCCPTNWR